MKKTQSLSLGNSQPGSEDRRGSKQSYSVDEEYATERTRKGVLFLKGSGLVPQWRKFEP